MKRSRLKKQISPAAKVTCGVIDEAYQAAIDAGAEGGKLLGAGGGGFLMFLCPTGAARFHPPGALPG